MSMGTQVNTGLYSSLDALREAKGELGQGAGQGAGEGGGLMLTSGKWQGLAWLGHRVNPSPAALVRLWSRQRVTDVFQSVATQSYRPSVLHEN